MLLYYCIDSDSQTATEDEAVSFDPDLVLGQLNNIMDKDLLSDDDFFSNASSSEGIWWVWLIYM